MHSILRIVTDEHPIVAVATVRDKQLKKELIEEDLSYMTVSTLVDLIQGNIVCMTRHCNLPNLLFACRSYSSS